MNGYKATPLRRLIGLAAAFCTAFTMSVTAFADEPYESYNYDNWDDAIPSQTGYTVDRVVSGLDMGLKELSNPDSPVFISEKESSSLNEARDIYNYNDKELWIADTTNNRVLCLDSNYHIKGCYKEAGGKSLKEPMGLFVTDSPTTGKQTVYIADSANERVVRATVESPTELKLEKEYTRPTEALYTATTYNPSKVVVDYAENVYVVVKSVNTGSVQFRADGTFMGFYGANRVNVTAKVIAQKLWRKIASQEQIEGMQRSVPVEYANFDMDNEGFIYTVTEIMTDTDAVKKINPAGYNIWEAISDERFTFGDHTENVSNLATKTTIATKLTDIAVDDNGLINVLDFDTGRVFQYDKFCNLICIFGARNSTGDQRGAFATPNAIETFGDKIVILEGSKTRNDFTVFKCTAFGNQLHKAFEYYDDGLYTEAVPYWNEVVKRDGCYTYAHIGLGKADLKNHDYKSAMKRFKIARSRKNYDKAFEYYRDEWLQQNFTTIAVVIIVLVVFVFVNKILKKFGINIFGFMKKKKKKGEN